MQILDSNLEVCIFVILVVLKIDSSHHWVNIVIFNIYKNAERISFFYHWIVYIDWNNEGPICLKIDTRLNRE